DTVGTEINPVPFDGYPNLHALLKCRTALSEACSRAAWAKFDITIPSAYFCWAFGRTDRQSLWWSLAPTNEDPRPQDLLNWPGQMDDATSRTDADVGVLLSKTTRDLRYDDGYYFSEFEGWLQSLLLQPQEVQVVLESRLTARPGPLDRLRLLVLPNVTALSEEAAAALRRYVEGGGKVLLTVDAGTLGPDGEPAAEPLFELAGVTLAEATTPPQPADLKIGPPNGTDAGPAGLGEPLGDVTLNAEHRRAAVAAGTDVVLDMSVEGEELPLLTRRRVGEGEVWYLAAKLGPLAFEDRQLSSHYRKDGFRPPEDARAIEVIQQVARLALGDTPAFRVDGAPRGLLASVYRAEHDGRPARAIHLLNCSGRDLQAGDPVEFDRDSPPPMPPLPEMTVVLPGQVSAAVLASPELGAPVALALAPGEEATRITIPAGAFSTYGVIWADD
ncbi:MAG TPA: beta-galactosidase trimerization domain-containing protein, partial [Armatimonadota bacterium]|nr:beta-galactosidase trimerization domain-containing protein [Armatimonadota bacterium]